jgi:hypothetical protein
MNLIDTVKDQVCSEDNIDQLSALLGSDEGATKSAVGAAVPSLMSALSNLASGSGAQKLVSALRNFDAGSMDQLNAQMSAEPDKVLEQGTGLLNSLFGGSTVQGIVNAVSKVCGMESGKVKDLLGYVMPMVLGGIAGRFAGKPVTAQGLASMLSDQKVDITNAQPSGLSPKDVPRLDTAGSTARGAPTATASAGSSLAKWLLPIAALVAIALIVWAISRRGEPGPVLSVPNANVSQLSTDVTGDVKSLTDSLAGIKDAISAEAAMPKLTEVSSKLDGIKAEADKLPAAEKAHIADAIKPSLDKLENQYAKLAWIPGVGDKIKPAVDGVMSKLASIAGLPTPEFPQLNGELAGVFSSLTNSLTGIKDAASAQAAVPKLKEMSGKLDDAKSTMEKLPADGKEAIRSMLKPALAQLKALTDKAVALPGVGEKIKPVLDEITGKLNALVA